MDLKKNNSTTHGELPYGCSTLKKQTTKITAM